VQLAAEQAKNLLLTGELRNANDENEALEAKNEAPFEAKNEAKNEGSNEPAGRKRPKVEL
jgi:hypothetical protein